jgi:hypothetical protein
VVVVSVVVGALVGGGTGTGADGVHPPTTKTTASATPTQAVVRMTRPSFGHDGTPPR